MIKKIIIPFILVLVLNSCGYSPIYSTKYQDFKINNLSFEGEKKINDILRKRLVSLLKSLSRKRIPCNNKFSLKRILTQRIKKEILHNFP